MNTSTTAALAASGLRKRFGGVHALRGVDVSFAPGSVHAVIGENGAGKSTLMKILAGVLMPDRGTIQVDGQPTVLHRVSDALDAGIALIHQELNLPDNLDVGANLFLGREPTRWGWIQKKVIRQHARRWLDRVGLAVHPSTPLAELTIGNRQLVEIAKALSIQAKVLIMDEPSSSLTLHETENLMSVIDDLRRDGVTVVYISHRLSEVQRVADDVTVLRDGENAGELCGDQIDHDSMVRMMVGRNIEALFDKHPHPPGDEVLRLNEIRTGAFPKQTINLSVRSGEVVGMAGLVGAGRSELLRRIFGVDPAPPGDRGSIAVAGEIVRIESPRDAIAAAMGFVPEDRKDEGVILSMSIRENIALPSLAVASSHPASQSRFVVRPGREKAVACEMLETLRIKASDSATMVSTLSGGNQQKVALAKWLAMRPRILLLDEPTRGVDIGAKEEIYRLVTQLAADGVGVLFVSSDMEEVLGLADRILVMHEGRLAGEFNRQDASEESIMRAAVGIEKK
ncbi:MAG: sugar ABC transporter ATP-binding protein [Planctomycetota bacterium]